MRQSLAVPPEELKVARLVTAVLALAGQFSPLPPLYLVDQRGVVRLEFAVSLQEVTIRGHVIAVLAGKSPLVEPIGTIHI